MTGLKTTRDVLEAQAAIGEQDDQVVDQVGGFVDRFLLTACRRGQCQLDTFFANFLRDAFRPGCSESSGVTLVSTALEPVVDDGLESGDKGDIRFAHVTLSGSKLGTVFYQVLFEVGNRDLGAVKYARS